jgi:lipoprotein LpqH
VKRGLLVAVGGAAIVIAGLSGCSSDEKKSDASSSSATSKSSSSSASASASGATKLTVDGADQPLSGTPACQKMGDTMNIAIGQSGTGVAAVIGGGDQPKVTSVALGNIGGVALAVGPGVGEATATKEGDTYTIKGNATGADMSNPMAGMVTKPFELVVACS